MDHNEFDFIDDLVKPFQDFIKKIEDGIKHKKKIIAIKAEKEEVKEENKDPS